MGATNSSGRMKGVWMVWMVVGLCCVVYGQQLRVGVICMPGFSHLKPMTIYMKELRARGHEVWLFTGDTMRDKFSHQVDRFYNFTTLSSDELVRIALAPGQQPGLLDFPVRFSIMEQFFLQGMVPLFDELQAENQLPDVLLVDFLTFAGFDIAEKYDLDAVASFPGLYYPFFYKSPFVSGGDLFNRIVQRLATVGISALGKYANLYSNEIRAEFDLPPWERFDKSYFLNHVSFVNSYVPLIEPSNTVSGMVHYVGLGEIDSHSALSDDLLSWIQSKDTPIVYVSFGTVAEQTPEFLDSLFSRMLNCKEFRFVWSLRDRLFESIRERYESSHPEHILRVAWVDQVELLNYVDIFLTHGGYGSLSETIYQSVPIICMPFFADQFLNCDRAEEIGIGRQMSSKDLDAPLCSLLNDVKNDPSVHSIIKEQSEFARVMSKGEGVREAIDKLELIARFGDDWFLPRDANLSLIARFELDLLFIQVFVFFLMGMCCAKCCCAKKRSLSPSQSSNKDKLKKN